MGKTKSIKIIGGGLSGLSAAVFLSKEEGVDLQILEATPKFGGRTYSFYDSSFDNMVDNGKHLIAGWYKKTLEYLDIIGTKDKINFQKSLAITMMDSTNEKFEFNTEKFFVPVNLFYGIMKIGVLSLIEKKNLILLLNKIRKGELNNYYNVSSIFEHYSQSDKAIRYFWNPIIYSIFNSPPEHVAPEYLYEVLKRGMASKEDSALGLPETNLCRVFINDAILYLKSNKVNCTDKTTIKEVISVNDEIDSMLTSGGKKVEADYFISAIPFWNYRKLFRCEDGCEFNSNSIISAHIKSKEEILAKIFINGNMIGLSGTMSQWIFKESRDVFSVVISGGNHILHSESGKPVIELETEILENLILSDLISCFEFLTKSDITLIKIIKEKRATFIPDKKSISARKSFENKFKNLFVCGDWTDTGLPSTIESSILSGWKAAEKIKEVLK